MRRSGLMIAIVMAALVLASGVAMAATVKGNNGDNNLRGTKKADKMYGKGGDDKLFAGRGSDRMFGGSGNDNLYGSFGNDVMRGDPGVDQLFGDQGNDTLVIAGDANQDFVECGPGEDTVVFDAVDAAKLGENPIAYFELASCENKTQV